MLIESEDPIERALVGMKSELEKHLRHIATKGDTMETKTQQDLDKVINR